ncbi:MAG: tetratricopeptide repeat protein [Trueperaceae bacterium]|nr:tetratricopeptide repeat protein [Trueperaceae bacterium]MCC6311825.1 tetratricopeptide repeat protein [Trueperaceae bacterium]MCO5173964.1 tetratricopeptide repeat protein [Trueperaceae bacterium]
MPRPARRLLLILAAAAAAFAPLSAAFAATLAIHPFDSDDTLLGFAVADELAAAFDAPGASELAADVGPSLLVLGPEVAGGAIPPLVADGGFVGLSRVVGGDVMFGPAGADLLRTGLGVDVAVTGRVLVMEDDYRLELQVAGEGGAISATLSAPHGRRDRLVAQAARVVARALAGGTPADAPSAVPTAVGNVPLEGAYATYLTAVVYAAGGLVTDAATVLTGVPAADLSPRAARLKDDLDAVVAGAPVAGAADADPGRLLRRAVLELGLPTFDDVATAAAFARVASATDLPLAYAWAAIMAVSAGDLDGAHEPLALAEAGGYPYAATLAASLASSTGDVEAYRAGLERVVAGEADSGSAALLGASVVAQMAEDTQAEKAALHALGRAAPFLTYTFERLSYIAFDEEDAAAAAGALAVAVQLDPESDLYWTNLGWSYYLLGFLERSEAASLHAVELDANQFIANYNVGLVRSVTGRLAEAVDAYDRAMRLDPSVDDEAIKDLESARSLYPDATSVYYSLGYLYDADGRRAEARTALRTFVRRAGAAGLYPEFVATATQRLVVLDAPPPPLELFGDVVVHLGVRGPEAAPFGPGDTLYPSFEVSTPGDELPATLHVKLALTVAEGSDLEATADSHVPAGAVGYVIDTVGLELPLDLAAGTYELVVTVEGMDGESVSARSSVEVTGSPVDLRRLLGRGVVMTALETSLPLYSAKDLATPDRLVDVLVGELRAGAAAAEQALPAIEGGRFAGLSGGALFSESSADDVRDYLAYLLASDLTDYRFTFVDGYAQWALDGAPEGPLTDP